jgi:hypothetical protein
MGLSSVLFQCLELQPRFLHKLGIALMSIPLTIVIFSDLDLLSIYRGNLPRQIGARLFFGQYAPSSAVYTPIYVSDNSHFKKRRKYFGILVFTFALSGLSKGYSRRIHKVTIFPNNYYYKTQFTAIAMMKLSSRNTERAPSCQATGDSSEERSLRRA